MSTAVASKRPTLGDYMSVTCFQFLRVGAEDIAGRVPIVAAGRERGTMVVQELGLIGKSADAGFIADQLRAALGPDGTRLCLVDGITAKPNGGYEVTIHEGACTAGVAGATEPHCAYTLGVFVGAVSAISGKRLKGNESTCAAMGNAHCVYQLDPM